MDKNIVKNYKQKVLYLYVQIKRLVIKHLKRTLLILCVGKMIWHQLLQEHQVIMINGAQSKLGNSIRVKMLLENIKCQTATS